MDNEDKLENKFNGFVEENLIGPGRKESFDVRGKGVYRKIYGGCAQCIGFVENGVAYENIIGGKPRVIGMVNYYLDINFLKGGNE
ncbi:MAG: hypothetical protein ACP5OG_03955 [Candidatus Nanoarchaeia archaeon]